MDCIPQAPALAIPHAPPSVFSQDRLVLQEQWTEEQMTQAQADLRELQRMHEAMDASTGPQRPPGMRQLPISDEDWARTRTRLRERVGRYGRCPTHVPVLLAAFETDAIL